MQSVLESVHKSAVQQESLVFYKSFNNLWLDVHRKVPKLSKKVLVCVFQLMKLRIGDGMLRVEV